MLFVQGVSMKKEYFTKDHEIHEFAELYALRNFIRKEFPEVYDKYLEEDMEVKLKVDMAMKYLEENEDSLGKEAQ